MLKWAGCFEENQSLSLLGLLFESLVESVVIAGATTIQLAEEGRRGTCTTKYDILRPVQAKVLRRWFGVGRSAPTKALLAEVGWTSMEWKLKVAKIRLWERVKAETDLQRNGEGEGVGKPGRTGHSMEKKGTQGVGKTGRS